MAEVWVVYWTEYGVSNIVGAFGSPEAADAYVRGRVDVSGEWSARDGRMYGVSGRPELTWFAKRFEVRG